MIGQGGGYMRVSRGTKIQDEGKQHAGETHPSEVQEPQEGSDGKLFSCRLGKTTTLASSRAVEQQGRERCAFS